MLVNQIQKLLSFKQEIIFDLQELITDYKVSISIESNPKYIRIYSEIVRDLEKILERYR